MVDETISKATTHAKRAKDFNNHLSKVRVVGNNAFGRLKGRWWCLLKQNESDTKNIPKVMASCVVLHNMWNVWRKLLKMSGLPLNPLILIRIFQCIKILLVFLQPFFCYKRQ